MGRWFRRLGWLWWTGIPATATYIAYASDIKGWASRLTDTASDAAPSLGAMLPPLALAVGVTGMIALFIFAGVAAHRVYRTWRHGDQLRFYSLYDKLKAGAELAAEYRLKWLRSTHLEDERTMEMVMLEADLYEILAELSELGIPVPTSISITEPKALEALIVYLTVLEGHAASGNLEDARNVFVPTSRR